MEPGEGAEPGEERREGMKQSLGRGEGESGFVTYSLPRSESGSDGNHSLSCLSHL